jgi:Asp/Glu/hydantoin racemase
MAGKSIALIHTSLVFILRERMILDLLGELLPDARLINIIDDSLLPDVMEVGHITPPVVQRMCNYFVQAEVAGASMIFNTCSSIGPAADVAKKLVNIPVVKIDEAMAESAASQASKIGVLATVLTTLGPTVDLVKEKAAEMKKPVTVESEWCGDAFPVLMRGDTARHDDMVSEGAGRLARNVELIVLAQASMARLAPRLSQETGMPVLFSPRMGVEHVKRVYESL